MSICESPHLQMRAPHVYLLLVQRQVQPSMLTVQTSFCRNKEPTADKPFFAGIFALLLVPALVILAIAFTSGYMVSSHLQHLKQLMSLLKTMLVVSKVPRVTLCAAMLMSLLIMLFHTLQVFPCKDRICPGLL